MTLPPVLSALDSLLPTTGPAELDFGRVLLLAVVQGLTEFLPVSSSGHLVLVEEALGVKEDGLTLEIALHVGTLFAVLAVYGKDLWRVAQRFFSGELKDGLHVVIGTLPTVAVALTLEDTIDAAFGDARGAAYGLLLTSVVLFVGSMVRRRHLASSHEPEQALVGRTELRLLDVIIIGCAQAVAILPGVSRSGSTISAGLLLGVRPDAAARFSFLLSVPAIVGAVVLKAPDLLEGNEESLRPALILFGIGVAALVGWASLRALLAFLGKGAFRWFAVYCAALGLGFLVLT